MTCPKFHICLWKEIWESSEAISEPKLTHLTHAVLCILGDRKQGEEQEHCMGLVLST